MEANEYQKQAGETAVYPDRHSHDGINYVIHGLTGEAGELSNKFKKVLRKGQRITLTDYTNREILRDELGDVLWYAALLADELGYTLSDVMQQNLDKLAKRKAEGTLKDRPEEPIAKISILPECPVCFEQESSYTCVKAIHPAFSLNKPVAVPCFLPGGCVK